MHAASRCLRVASGPTVLPMAESSAVELETSSTPGLDVVQGGHEGIDAYVARLVAEAPPLAPEIRARLASLLSD